MSTLVFIDTNILLDFYRVRGGDTSLSILDRFDNHHNKIITSYQIEMEYKKNRQAVILESLCSIKKPDFAGLAVPVFLRQSQPQQTLKKAKKQIDTQVAKLKERTAKLLKNPSHTDHVYKVLQRLFRAKGEFHLTRDKKIRYKIRHLARKRFTLGYPPRKDRDLSIGDAVNWEWIIHCANSSNHDIVIVSRDTDFGVVHDREAILNDWLRQEFKERVSARRKITLTTRLTEAFKQASITVTRKEEREEKQFLDTWVPIPRIDFSKLEFPRLGVSMLDLSKLEYPRIGVPTFDLSKIKMPRLGIPTTVDLSKLRLMFRPDGQLEIVSDEESTDTDNEENEPEDV